MAALPVLSENLRAARRAIDELPALALVEDLSWSARAENWVLCVDVTIGDPTEHVPATTRWWFHVDERYPWGSITVYPAKQGGITATFHHQDLNLEGEKESPWRTGDICVKSPGFELGRLGLDDDPVGRPERLHWYLERLIDWVKAAATGTLVAPGQAFELPQFDPGKGVVGYLSGPEDLKLFDGSRVGIVDYVGLRGDPLQLVVERFWDGNGKLLREVPWGEHVRQAKTRVRGLWLKTEGIPVLPPYRAPVTWGELRQVFQAENVELDELLKAGLNPLREGQRLFGILGFPIPSEFGGPATQMRWQAFHMPAVSSGEDFFPGFRRDHPGSYWLLDRSRFFRDGDRISWLQSENWTPAELSSRGRLPEVVRRSKTAFIGAGAVGAPLSELMVRGGVDNVLVVDGDRYHLGNGVRHTLLLDDVESFKAPRLTDRLNRISPLVKAIPVKALFPELKSDERRQLLANDLIVDCTGSDDVVAALEGTEFPGEKWFWSVSLSLGAKRGYVFSAHGFTFPGSRFHELIQPWVAKDREENVGTPLRWEGTGCWHPVFPASADEVSLMVAAALRYLTEAMSKDMRTPTLAVFERTTRAGMFSGVQRVDDEAK